MISLNLGINRMVLIGATCLLVAGCGGGKHETRATRPELPVAEVRTATVETKTSPALEEVVGTVRPRLRASVEAKASGRVVELPVVLGQKVKAGDLLARLEAPEINARLNGAEAALQQAERDWKRISSLHEQQAATRSDYDAAQSRLELAKAGLSEARALLDYVVIKAPFDGVITRKVSDVGDLAVPGKTLVELEDPSGLRVEADVPEAIAGRIETGARMMVRRGTGSAELPALVAEFAPTADPVSRTFLVKLDLPSGHGLRSGQFARLVVPVGEVASMRVPAAAVIHRGQMEIVFAIEDQRARLHLVKTGRQLGNDIEILSGLNAGDSVVVEGAGQLLDGQPVTIQ